MLVYMIWCEATEKLYVGQTTKTLKQRWSAHVSDSKKPDSSHSLLHEEIRLLGPGAFEQFELERCASIQELNERETWWIAYTSADDPALGYNLQAKGANHLCTEETKRICRAAALGDKQWAEKRDEESAFKKMSDAERSEYFRTCGLKGAQASLPVRVAKREARDAEQLRALAEKRAVKLSKRLADAERKRRWASMSESDRRAFLSECGKRGAARAKLSRQ